MSKLHTAIGNLTDRQTTLEKKIKNNSMQAQQLHNKLIKISNTVKPHERVLGVLEQNKLETEESFINDQLELNIRDKNKNQSGETLENNFLSWDVLLKALNFPNDENDLVGFSALNLARKNNTILQLLQVSEDFLNLLAQDGIYRRLCHSRSD